MTDIGTIPVTGTVEVQAIATGPGGTTFSPSFYLIEGDCSGTCGFTVQPSSVVGSINDPVDFGLSLIHI